MWKQDDQVTAVRKRHGWGEFHQACGRQALYFDHIEREGKRGPYRCTAFTGKMSTSGNHFLTFHLADGSGKTPLDAVVDAYRKAGRPVADMELDDLIAGQPAGSAVVCVDVDDLIGGDTIDIDDLLGGDEPAATYEDLLG